MAELQQQMCPNALMVEALTLCCHAVDRPIRHRMVGDIAIVDDIACIWVEGIKIHRWIVQNFSIGVMVCWC